MTSLEVAITRLAHGEGLTLPDYASAGAAGVDLRAATRPDETLVRAIQLAVVAHERGGQTRPLIARIG